MPTSSPFPPPPPRARSLLAYFLRHPKREETLEEVVRWRIRQDIADFTLDEVTKAIEWLEKEQFVVRERTVTGSMIIRLNEERIAAAQQFLSDAPAALFESDRARDPSESGKDAGAARPLLQKIIPWLDATLLCALQEHQKSVGDQPLTISHTLAGALLTARDSSTGADPADACEAANAAARELERVLNESGAEADPLAALFHRLSLEFIEFKAVLLALAPELDAVYQLVFGVLNDDMGRRAPTLGLLCQLLGPPASVREALSRTGGLTRWRLPATGATLPHADEPFHLDPSIVAWLLGGASFDDPRLHAFVRRQPWPGASWMRQPDDLVDIEALARRLPERLSGQLPGQSCDSTWILLTGGDASIWRALVEAAAEVSGACLVRISITASMSASMAAHTTISDLADVDVAWRLTRAILLQGAIPVIDVTAASQEGDRGERGERAGDTNPLRTIVGALEAGGLTGIVIAGEVEDAAGALPRTAVDVRRRERPGEATLATAFAAAAADAGLYLHASDTKQLARAFPLPLDALDEAVRVAVLEGAAGQPAAAQAAILLSACRRIAAPSLPRFARRVHPVFTLDDIVLPADRLRQLREIVANVTYAPQVLETWGFGAQLPYGRGVAALFSGPSGTGKTMAAQAIAHALQTDAFIVDLSRVMSKYVGESEKNIDLAFRDAERAGAVLQIDEAEALFSKRTEAKDSHDRYANFLVSFLLHRMESFDGVAILTTNFGRTVDQAFLRRLRFVIEFPRPDADAREAIWRRCLPAGAPVAADVNLRFLARRFELSGGNIRSITLRAAFLAVSEGAGGIEMRHLIAATRAELLKLGMNAAERELAEFEAAQRPAGARVA